MARARLSGRAFYCEVLAGNDGYNLSVNSDMTVSCTCADYDGAGVIGDLSRGALEEIMAGPRAAAFRAQLAAGRLPVLYCVTCGGLRTAPARECAARAPHYRVPVRGVMVENTSACNLRCVSCPRELIGKSRSRRTMTLADIERVADEVHRHGIETVSYFKLGEPFMSQAIFDELSILRRKNPHLNLRLETNGLLIDSDTKREAALLTNQIRFALDGVDDATVRKYRTNGSFTRAYDNFQKLIAYRNRKGLTRPSIEWKYIVFNWNDSEDMMLRAVQLAEEAGADRILFCPTVSPFWAVSLRYKLKRYSAALTAGRRPSGCIVELR